jgi:O-antigen ligase
MAVDAAPGPRRDSPPYPVRVALIRRNLPVPATWPPPREAAGAAALHDYSRRRDPVGHQVHTVLAALFLFLLPLATAPKDVAFALLLGYALLRLPNTWRSYTPLLGARLVWALAAWTAWTAITILWSSNRAEGAEELGAFRAVLLPFMLWPVLDRLPWLIGAMLLGVAAQNGVQACQGLRLFGLAPADDGRLRGLIHPIQTGAFCAAAMCWHVSGWLVGKGWVRWASLAGLGAAGAGLVATGSRSTWIAAAVAVPLAFLLVAVRRPRRRRAVAVLAVIGVVAALGAWPLASDMVVRRVTSAWNEMRMAREEHRVGTSTGLRLAMWDWAWEIFRDHPLIGVGAGGYRTSAQALPEFSMAAENATASQRDYLDRGHPHSSYLHVLATTGVIGGAAFLAVIALALCNAWRDEAGPPGARGESSLSRSTAHACQPVMVAALVTWLIGAQFDAYHLNGHLFGLLGVIAAATLPLRPPVRRAWRAADVSDPARAE